MKYVIKASGELEHYDNKKLFASIYRTCLACDIDHTHATDIARQVSKGANEWLGNKTEVSSHDIRAHAHASLRKLNKQAGCLYAHHRIIA